MNRFLRLRLKSAFCMLLTLLSIHVYAQESIKVSDLFIQVVDVQTVSVVDTAGVSYSGKSAEFNVQAVTEALGVESIASATQYIVNPTTWEAVSNTSDGWRSGDGDLCGWGDITEQTRGYCVKIQEPESGKIDYLGAHHNGAWTVNDTFTAYWAFVVEDKAALVKVDVSFIASEGEPEDDTPEVELPEPETTIANLTIVGSAQVSSERYYTQGYETSGVYAQIPRMADALGLEKATLAAAFGKMIYVDQFVDGYNSGTLALLTSTDGWLRQYQDPETMELDGALAGAKYDAADEVFVQQMAYNAANDTVSFIVGQMPGKMEKGETRHVDLYVVYGQKAFVITYTVNFVEPPYHGLEDMTKVGEQTVEVSQEPTKDYSGVSFTIDLENIATLLGAESTADIQMSGLTSNGGLSSDHTANNGGWWLDAEGAVHNYNGGTFFIEPKENNNWTEFNVGQMPNVSTGGEVYTAKLYLTYGEKYYELTVKYTISEKQEIVDPSQLHVVATRTIRLAQQVATDFQWSDGVVIPYTVLENAIGTTECHLYGETAESTEETPVYTDDYSCTPYPGFWMTAEGRCTTWGNGQVWGISIANETNDEGIVINGIQHPGSTALGDTFNGSFYLANTEDGAMLKLEVEYSIVENVEAYETVGSENLVMKVAADESYIELPLAEIATKLGYESEEELLDADCLRAVGQNGVYGDFFKPSNGVTVNEEGYEEESAATGIYFDNGMIYTYCNAETAPTQWKAEAELCFENEGKRYILHITLCSADIYDDVVRIDGLPTLAAKTATFDLQGRLVKNARKGIFIQNGKKVMK